MRLRLRIDDCMSSRVHAFVPEEVRAYIIDYMIYIVSSCLDMFVNKAVRENILWYTHVREHRVRRVGMAQCLCVRVDACLCACVCV